MYKMKQGPVSATDLYIVKVILHNISKSNISLYSSSNIPQQPYCTSETWQLECDGISHIKVEAEPTQQI